MNKATWGMLNDVEKALLRETDKDALAGLDEDTLLDLHTRVRRARTKYSKLYRRRAGAAVGKDRTRAGAHPKNARTAAKAEAFEDALARVSRSLARAARASADALRTERLGQAKKAKDLPKKSPKKRSGGSSSAKKASSGTRAPRKTPASKRARAAARSTQKRSQAKRDRS